MKAVHALLGLVLAASLSIPAVNPAQAAEGGLQFADLGECKLESGEVIKDCRIGYRTLGTLNADKSNAVLVLLPAWDENDESREALYNEAKWVDPSKHFVIVIDPLGNNVSVGPDNSKAQPGAKFPKVSMRDMMEIDRRVLREALKLDRVYAIMGEHLGGMQALEWMVTYPEEMDKVIAIAATPKPAEWDVLTWQGMVDILSRPRTTRQDDEWAALAVGVVNSLMLLGPPSRAKAISAAYGPRTILSGMESAFLSYGLHRWAMYARAIVGHDIYRAFDGSPEKAVAAAKAKLLVMVSPDDQLISTGPIMDLAKLMDSKVVALSKDVPETWIPGTDGALIQKEARTFLAK